MTRRSAKPPATPQVKHRHRVGFPFLPAAALALAAMLLVGCGGGGDPRGKVEGGLQDYFSTFNPEDSVFPTGDGPPRVKNNACKELPQKFPFPPPDSVRFIKVDRKVALWRCFVRFNNFTLTVDVLVNDSNEVLSAMPVYGDNRETPKLSPARTYTG